MTEDYDRLWKFHLKKLMIGTKVSTEVMKVTEKMTTVILFYSACRVWR